MPGGDARSPRSRRLSLLAVAFCTSGWQRWGTLGFEPILDAWLRSAALSGCADRAVAASLAR